MTVYVDDMYRTPMGRYRRMRMSHMMADTAPELLEMAKHIGLPSKYLQHPNAGRDRMHFDISKTKRVQALQFGAVAVTSRQLVLIRRGWRTEDAGSTRSEGSPVAPQPRPNNPTGSADTTPTKGLV